jgi:hypothetical protein
MQRGRPNATLTLKKNAKMMKERNVRLLIGLGSWRPTNVTDRTKKIMQKETRRMVQTSTVRFLVSAGRRLKPMRMTRTNPAESAKKTPS